MTDEIRTRERQLEASRKWKRNHPRYFDKYHDKLYEYNRRRQADFKSWLDDIRSGLVCESCGAIDRLQFHHPHPFAKSFDVSKGWKHSREAVVEEMKKCVVLCICCHQRIPKPKRSHD